MYSFKSQITFNLLEENQYSGGLEKNKNISARQRSMIIKGLSYRSSNMKD
jgi:hypothetical protein